MKSKKRSLFSLIYMTFAVSNPWLIASVVMSVVSAGMSIYQGYQQQKIANANARNKEIIAQRQQLAANRKAKLAAEKRKKQRAGAVVAFVSGGVWIDEGSPLIVEAEDDYRSELDQATIIAQGAEQAWVSHSEAMIMRAQGRAAVTAGYGQAAGTIGASLLSAGSGGGSSPASKGPTSVAV